MPLESPRPAADLGLVPPDGELVFVVVIVGGVVAAAGGGGGVVVVVVGGVGVGVVVVVVILFVVVVALAAVGGVVVVVAAMVVVVVARIKHFKRAGNSLVNVVVRDSGKAGPFSVERLEMNLPVCAMIRVCTQSTQKCRPSSLQLILCHH